MNNPQDIINGLLLGRPPEPYNDGGAGAHNAAVLDAARVRPAFFDVSCMLYRLLYAKADWYCNKAGGTGYDADRRLCHLVCIDLINDMADACRQFACGPVVAFDSKHSFRKELLLPSYKEGRREQKKTPSVERVLNLRHEVLKLLREVYCTAYKIQFFCVYGYESDDVIAAFVLGLKQQPLFGEPAYNKPVVIVTSDHDLHQLLIDGVFLADVATGILCTGEQVAKHTKVRPEDVVLAKCVGGCASDAINGVTGCGEKTVAEVLEKRSFDVKVKRAKNNLQSKEGLATLYRNWQLIRLPFQPQSANLAEAFPLLKLSKKTWPAAYVPDVIRTIAGGMGIPETSLPMFSDITLPRPLGAIPVCEWKRKSETKEGVEE